MTHVLKDHEVVKEEDTLALEELPDRLSPLDLALREVEAVDLFLFPSDQF